MRGARNRTGCRPVTIAGLTSQLVLLGKLSKRSKLLLQRPSHGYSPSHKRRQRHQGNPRYPPLHYDHRFASHSILPRLMRLRRASWVTPSLSAASATVALCPSPSPSTPRRRQCPPVSSTSSLLVADLSKRQPKPSLRPIVVSFVTSTTPMV